MKAMLALVAALLALAAVAQVGDPAAGVTSEFDSLDEDKDGGISATEAQAHPAVAQKFAVADRNRNGVLTRDEFSAAFSTPKPSKPEPTLPRAPEP